MKKRMLVLTTAAFLTLGVSSVKAVDMSNTSQTGDIPVTAEVSNGAVTYIVSIPEAVDFGTLTQPADTATEHNVTRTISIAAKELTGLPTANKLVVLMQDAANKSENSFCIVGQDAANAGKKLQYEPVNSISKQLVTDGNLYANGYLIGVFNAAGEEFNLDLNLDQNQLYGVDLNAYAGSYKGTLSFYTKIASVSDYVTN